MRRCSWLRDPRSSRCQSRNGDRQLARHRRLAEQRLNRRDLHDRLDAVRANVCTGGRDLAQQVRRAERDGDGRDARREIGEQLPRDLGDCDRSRAGSRTDGQREDDGVRILRRGRDRSELSGVERESIRNVCGGAVKRLRISRSKSGSGETTSGKSLTVTMTTRALFFTGSAPFARARA